MIAGVSIRNRTRHQPRSSVRSFKFAAKSPRIFSNIFFPIFCDPELSGTTFASVVIICFAYLLSARHAFPNLFRLFRQNELLDGFHVLQILPVDLHISDTHSKRVLEERDDPENSKGID